MKKNFVALLLVAGGLTAVPVGAEQFTFTVKNLSLTESRALPGGYGDYGSVIARNTSNVKTPPAKSAYPLYGVLFRNQSQGRPCVFLDESKGTGKGYDRMIIDLNENGDFTDDPVVNGLPSGVNSSSSDFEQSDFGPIDLPENKAKGIWRPKIFANIYLYNKNAIKEARNNGETQVGQLRIHAANLLETSVELNGVKQKFGLVDANCNFTVGDSVTVSKIKRRPDAPESWYMSPGDYFLRDVDNSGKFERSQTVTEAQPFSKFIYFGGKPYTVKVSDNLSAIDFQPFTGPSGKLKIKGDVTELVLGLDGASCEAVSPDIVGGQAIVPAGKYHLSRCVVSAKNRDGFVRVQSSDVPDKVFTVSEDNATELEAGQPLVLSVLTEKTTGTGESSSLMGSARRLFGGSPGQSYELRMNVEVNGTGGEKYAGFTRSSGEYVPAPRFQVCDAQGKELLSGNFEYG
jgi:hypothetical protein